MKTNPSLKIFKLSSLIALGIVSAAALVTQPVLAAVLVNNSIVLTENSSTSLTATYKGSTSGVTVTFNSLDHWTVTFPASVSFFSGPFSSTRWWQEPEPSPDPNFTLANFVFLGGHTVTVASEQRTNLGPGLPNNTASPSVGVDGIVPISMTFNDHSDVPDTGATLGLLFVSVIALLGLNRLRPVQLA
jgi:hypothetical protein